MWVPLLPHIPEVPASILLLLTDGVPFDATGLFGKKLLTTESKLQINKICYFGKLDVPVSLSVYPRSIRFLVTPQSERGPCLCWDLISIQSLYVM